MLRKKPGEKEGVKKKSIKTFAHRVDRMGYWARSFRDAAHVRSLDDDDDEFLPTGENEDKLKHLWGDLGPIDAAGNFWRKFHFLSPEKLPDWLLCALLPRSPKFGHLLDNCTIFLPPSSDE